MSSDADKPLSPEQLAIEKRRLAATRLALEGWPTRAIGLELNVSHTQIRRDLDAVRAEWKAEAAENLETLRDRLVARLEHQIAVAWAAYHKTVGKHTVTRTETGGKDDGKEVVTSEEQPGDPRFLAEVRHCEDQIAKLRGAYAAVQIETTHKGVLAVDGKLLEGV